MKPDQGGCSVPASVRGPQLSRWTSKACGPFYTSPGLALLTGWLDVIPPLPSFCTLTLSQLNSWSKTTYYRYLERDTHKNQTRRRRTCESTIVSSQIWFLLQTGKVKFKCDAHQTTAAETSVMAGRVCQVADQVTGCCSSQSTYTFNPTKSKPSNS